MGNENSRMGSEYAGSGVRVDRAHYGDYPVQQTKILVNHNDMSELSSNPSVYVQNY